MDQIQEKKTTKSTIRNRSKYAFLILIYKSHMITTTKHKYKARKL